MGGYSALYAVDRDLAAQYFKERFRATIASYPRLQHPRGLGDRADPGPDRGGGRLDPGGTVPRDGSTCTPDGATIALTVYPSAYHAFDAAQLKPGTRFLGHSLEHSEPVARDADQKLRAFLAAKIGRHIPGRADSKVTEAGMAYPTRLIPATVVGRVAGPLPFR